MRYTVTCDYCATGEGRTLMLLYVLAQDEQSAMKVFAEAFGDWFALGAEVNEGFDFDHHVAHVLLTESVKKILETDMMVQYHCFVHYNAS